MSDGVNEKEEKGKKKEKKIKKWWERGSDEDGLFRLDTPSSSLETSDHGTWLSVEMAFHFLLRKTKAFLFLFFFLGL